MKPADLVALDANALTYLVEAVSLADEYEPTTDMTGLADERVSMVRCLMYWRLWVGPQVDRQIQDISNPGLRSIHGHLRDVLLHEGGIEVPQRVIDHRTDELQSRHADRLDCRIVAEAEVRGCTHLLTRDKRLISRLGGVAAVKIRRPSDFWAELAIPRGTPPQIEPHQSNPLGRAHWWRW